MNPIKEAIEALEEVADRLDGIKGGSVSESIQMLRTAIANLRLSPEAVPIDGSFPPRNIIFDSLHPDYPVEWSNPGRPAREGEVHYIRYDLFSDAVHALAALRSMPAEPDGLMSPANLVDGNPESAHLQERLTPSTRSRRAPDAAVPMVPSRHETLTLNLYGATPHTAPLSDAEIDEITEAQWGKEVGAMKAAHRAYARAIERAVLGRGGEQ